MHWHQPVMDDGRKPNNFAWWFYASIFLLSFVLYFLVMFFLNYGDNLKSLLELIVNLLLVPLIMAIACSLFAYNYYLSLKINYQFRVNFIESKRQLWQSWIQQSIAIIGYSYLSPVENNAIKIIGLDGQARPNANQNLTIERIDNQFDSRLNKTLQDLLSSLVNELQKNSRMLVIDVYAPYLSSQLKDALMIFSQKNNLMINVDEQVNFLSSIPDMDLVNKSIQNENKSRLLILLSLHAGSRTTTSEFAVALLFSNSRIFEPAITKVYRPLGTDLINLGEDFSLLVNSEQVERQSLRHIWAVNMIDSAMNTIIAEVVENDLLIDVNHIHRLDLYEGKIDQAHAWLAIAYACEAVDHGQKGQLVTLQIEDNIDLLQIEKTTKKPKNNNMNMINDFPITYLFSVILLLIAICFLPQDNDERKLLLLFVLCGSFFFALLLSVSMPLKRKMLTKKLEHEWMQLRRENNE